MTLLKQLAAVYVVLGFVSAIAVIVVEASKNRSKHREPSTAVFVLALIVMPLAWLPLFAWAFKKKNFT